MIFKIFKKIVNGQLDILTISTTTASTVEYRPSSLTTEQVVIELFNVSIETLLDARLVSSSLKR